MDNDFHDIASALQPYFDGWYEADVEKLKQVFHPSCHLFCVLDGRLDDDDMEKVYKSVANRQSPKSRGEVRRDKILSIHKSSGEIGLAVVQLSIGDKLFTDYLSMAKLNGEWRILSKTFSFLQISSI